MIYEKLRLTFTNMTVNYVTTSLVWQLGSMFEQTNTFLCSSLTEKHSPSYHGEPCDDVLSFSTKDNNIPSSRARGFAQKNFERSSFLLE